MPFHGNNSGNLAGLVPTSDPYTLIESPKQGRRRIGPITLHNPNSAAMGFKLRFVWPELRTIGDKRVTVGELTVTRFDDSMDANDSWVFGTLGGRIILFPTAIRYELVLDSAPVNPIEWALDFEDLPI